MKGESEKIDGKKTQKKTHPPSPAVNNYRSLSDKNVDAGMEITPKAHSMSIRACKDFV